MKIRTYAYIFAVTCLFLSGCHKNSDLEEQRFSWSTDSPLTIPYRIRIQRLDKNNLVRNPSFETGRTFTLDSSLTSFVIDGWQQVGRHIEWVDLHSDSLYKPNEVFSGYRAIKIVRTTALETDDQGEGIMSDFIKVIPGNYRLSLYAKLENVFPLKARLGTRMYDGVDISLLFFDRNKIPIKPGIGFPQINQVINASFKSLSFANFDAIPSFGWGKVIGKSAHFPFPEGDIPSEAHYVKIFIGLKGTGTMWVDSVTFNYTDLNFSVAEKMQKFTDTAFSEPYVFIPTPKKVRKMESVIFYKPAMEYEQLPLILVPADADEVVLNAARLIQQALQQCIIKHNNPGESCPSIRITNECSLRQLNDSKLVISLGSTNLYENYRRVLPRQEISGFPQGYFIYTGDVSNHVILGANSSTGIYYAALTAVQMIDSKQPVFHNARVVDYPDFTYRFYAIEKTESASETEQQAEIARELITYKINGAFLMSETEDLSSITHETDVSFSTIPGTDLFKIIRMPRFLMPDDSTLTYKYPVHFPINERGSVNLTNDLLQYTIAGFSEYVHFIIPPVYHNQLMDNSDYPVKSIPLGRGIKGFYSGSSFFSLNTDDADIERYTALTGAKPVFMDNSMRISSRGGKYGGNDHHYPGKIRLYNVFNPFANTEIREHFSKLDSTLFFVNQPANTEIDVIRLATAAEFLWNSGTYSKDYSLWKVLMSRYGADIARQLISYADKYGLMLEMILRLEMKDQQARSLKGGQLMVTDLTILVTKIAESLGSQHKLVKELLMLNEGLKNRLNSYSYAGISKNKTSLIK